jgi:hypothetical protein
MMSTGIETWNMNLLEIGALYPFPGTEVLLTLIGLGSWIVWHIIQIKAENAALDKEKRNFSDKAKLKKAMDISNAESLSASVKGHASDF